MIDAIRRTHRTKVLDCYVFDSLQEVRNLTAVSLRSSSV